MVGGGFLGSHIAGALCAAGVRTTVLTRSTPSAGSAGARVLGARVVEGDAADAAVFDDALTGCTQVVWCAGGLLPGESNADPIGDVLLSLPAFLTGLEALRRRPGVHMTFFSSGGAVYGEPGKLPVAETHPLSPITSYAVMKVTAEHYLSVYRALYDVPSLVLRCANVYGEGQPGDRSQGVVAAVLDRVRVGEPVPLFGDGTAMRDFVHIDDVVPVVLGLAGRRDTPPVVNVGSGTGTKLADLLGLVAEVTGATVQIERHPARAGDVHSVVLDIGLLRSLLRFEPLPLRAGLSRTWSALSEAALTSP